MTDKLQSMCCSQWLTLYILLSHLVIEECEDLGLIRCTQGGKPLVKKSWKWLEFVNIVIPFYFLLFVLKWIMYQLMEMCILQFLLVLFRFLCLLNCFVLGEKSLGFSVPGSCEWLFPGCLSGGLYWKCPPFHLWDLLQNSSVHQHQVSNYKLSLINHFQCRLLLTCPTNPSRWCELSWALAAISRQEVLFSVAELVRW